jgi:hypothetical protein
MDQSVIARFWAKVDRDGPTMPHMDTPCWEWRGHVSSRTGYGTFKLDRRTQLVHRVSLSWALGRPLKLQALHYCDNRVCVRPDHLHEGTQGQNMREMVLRGRSKLNHLVGADRPNARLTPEAVKEIRTRRLLGESLLTLSEDYGVSQALVSLVARYKAWKHVP